MKRYIARPRLADWNDDPDGENYLARTVFETDPSPRPTGLLDAQGNELFAVIDMSPIGFVRLKSNA